MRLGFVLVSLAAVAAGIGVTEEEKRERETERVLADATKEARSRSGEFKKAFRTREKTGAKTLSVTFENPLSGEEAILMVDEVRGDRIKGSALGHGASGPPMVHSDMTVFADEILDWSYRIGNKHFGGFRLKALAAHLKKQIEK